MRVLGLLLLLSLSSVSLANQRSNPQSNSLLPIQKFNTKMLATLASTESFNAQVVQAGLLWVGATRGDNGTDKNELLVFNMEGKLIHQTRLGHQISEIFPYKNDSVVITGNDFIYKRRKWITKTYATFLRWTGTRVIETQIYDWPSPRENLYFSSHGDKMIWGSNGPEEDKAKFAGGDIQEISGLKMVKPNLITTLLGGSDDVNQNIMVQNTELDTYEPLLVRGELTRPYDLTQTSDSTVAVADRDTNRIVVSNFVDKTSLGIPAQVERPRALATLGNCILVAAEKEHKIAFLHQKKNYEVIDIWDLSEVAKELRDFRKVSVDAASAQVFIRSAFPLEYLGGTNGVMAVSEATPNTFPACLND